MMTNQADEQEHHLQIDLDGQIEPPEEAPLAGRGWDTNCAILARIPNSDPEVSDDWDYDRTIFVSPTVSGLRHLEDSQLSIRAMYFYGLTLKSVFLISIKRIVTWPTRTDSGELQSILTLEDGTYYLIGENAPLHLRNVTVDWSGTGKYVYNKDSKTT